MTSRIPVTLLTGFLGSGKTTLVNALLRHPGLSDTAVIVNEFGAIALDHLLITAADDNVVLLGGGCLCCAAPGGLRETLADLFVRRVNGTVPRFRRVLIETSGLADPGPVVNAIAFDSLVQAEYELSSIVATVDALHGQRQLDEHPEAVQQAALADALVITKADVASAAQCEAVRERLRSLNPTARIEHAANGAIDPALLLEVSPEARRAPRWLPIDRPGETGQQAPAISAYLGARSARHSAGIDTVAAVLGSPVSWAGLAAWTAIATELFGRDLLRVKGLLHIAERGAPVIVHAVAGQFHRPQPLAGWPSDDHRSRVVIIARNVARPALLTSLKALSLPAGAGRPMNLAELAALDLEEPHAV